MAGLNPDQALRVLRPVIKPAGSHDLNRLWLLPGTGGFAFGAEFLPAALLHRHFLFNELHLAFAEANLHLPGGQGHASAGKKISTPTRSSG